VRGEGGLTEAVALAGAYSSEVLIERYIPGREITVAVLGADPLPVVEIVPESGLYDYESKYTKGKSAYHCPADLPGSLATEIQRAGLAAYRALGCRGYARVDFRLSPEGEAHCLEVNTTPGMTEVSLVPMAARAAGVGFGDLLERILRMALE
jgi:D-alanine-D-alanine ligase